jgi:hypothetical protein
MLGGRLRTPALDLAVEKVRTEVVVPSSDGRGWPGGVWTGAGRCDRETYRALQKDARQPQQLPRQPAGCHGRMRHS